MFKNKKRIRDLIDWKMCIVVISFICLAVFLLSRPIILLQNKDDYQKFKDNTEVIEGVVTKDKVEKHWYSSDEYYLVVNDKKGNYKLVEVNEAQYRDNQKGSKVKFRIDTSDKNKVKIDLNKSKDIESKKEYQKYKEKNDKEDFGLFMTVD
ncbi:hypothetical protein [Staphylococcus capitis]|uniref:Uncharacterized protein n=1 Tax=Staphylococcus capitis TaxID=29388 RepID=A0ABX1SQZ8_STACP|nr:hypothetical protein [Staphylococcus capitis]NMK54017.1 hypothetical protein [Staphylococcus capitis]NMK69291.1 hypothetical protein [Staphylococcus capitis]